MTLFIQVANCLGALIFCWIVYNMLPEKVQTHLCLLTLLAMFLIPLGVFIITVFRYIMGV